MNDVFIVDAVRTPIGRLGGALKNVQADDLAAHVLTAIQQRSPQVTDVEEVILGQSRQSADAANIARVAALKAGIPISAAAYTVHRQCGSGLQAINNAAQQIALGLSDVIIAGGTESMSNAQYYLRQARYGYTIGNAALLDPNIESQLNSQPQTIYGSFNMGMTAENLAEKYSISRKAQDEFALRSQQLTAQAIEQNAFMNSLVPYTISSKKGDIIFSQDEHPRMTSLEKLAQLQPVFKENGSVTAGSSSGRNDGASVVLLMSKQAIDRYSIQPKAKIIAQAAAGVSPEIMGIGPVYSTEKALQQANLSIDDIDLIELNEAFAAQALAVIQEANFPLEKVNVNGGAIALGHPIGATGSIILTKLIDALIAKNKRYGLATLCIGGGQGITTIIENCTLS